MGLQDKIRTVQGTMEKLPFAQEELDLIWSEGAIYIMGFERGIQEWKQYLKRGGYLVVSEINWLTNSRPKELEEFWNSQYAEMQTSSQKIQILENNGYKPVGYFVVSEQSWIENYYKPMEGRYLSFLEKHKNSEMAKRIVEEHQQEFQQYQDYKDFYSYGFYIAQKME